MNRITKILREHPRTKATINDVKTIPVKSLKRNDTISKAQKYLTDKYKLGGQYEFLAKFTKEYGLKLEVGLESSIRSKASNALRGEADLALRCYATSLPTDDWGGYLELNPAASNKEIFEIFENLRMPSHLFSIEKLEEVELMKEWDLEKAMKSTWFCHHPVLGFPCGHCNPCKDALNEGLAWRVPLKGRILGTVRRGLHIPIAITRKALKFISRQK